MALKLGKTAVLHFFSQVASSVSGFVATFVIARFLGAEGVGIYALGLTLLVWLNLPLSGFRQAMIKRLSEGVETDKYLSSGLILNISASFVLAGTILVFRDYVNEYVGAEVAFLLIAIVFSNTLFKTSADTLKGLKKVAHAGWLRAAERVLRAAAQILLILLGYKISGLFVGHAVSMVLGTVLGVLLIGVKPTIPRVYHFRRLVSYAKYSWSSGLKGISFNWMDTVVLGFFVTPSLIGIYEVSWSLASFLVVASNSVNSTLFPEISQLSVDEEYQKVHHYLNEGLVFTGIFLIPGLFGAAAVGEDLLRIYDGEFTQGYYILVMLITARVFDSYAEQMVSVIRAIDKPDVALRIDSVFFGVNMSLNFVLVYLYGWYGAAVATVFSGIVTLFLGYYSLSKLIGRPEVPYAEIGKEVAAGCVMFVAVTLLQGQLPSGHHITVVLVGVGAVVYMSVLLVLSRRIRQKVLALIG